MHSVIDAFLEILQKFSKQAIHRSKITKNPSRSDGYPA